MVTVSDSTIVLRKNMIKVNFLPGGCALSKKPSSRAKRPPPVHEWTLSSESQSQFWDFDKLQQGHLCSSSSSSGYSGSKKNEGYERKWSSGSFMLLNVNVKPLMQLTFFHLPRGQYPPRPPLILLIFKYWHLTGRFDMGCNCVKKPGHSVARIWTPHMYIHPKSGCPGLCKKLLFSTIFWRWTRKPIISSHCSSQINTLLDLFWHLFRHFNEISTFWDIHTFSAIF